LRQAALTHGQSGSPGHMGQQVALEIFFDQVGEHQGWRIFPSLKPGGELGQALGSVVEAGPASKAAAFPEPAAKPLAGEMKE
jgi:hypothetical protein